MNGLFGCLGVFVIALIMLLVTALFKILKVVFEIKRMFRKQNASNNQQQSNKAQNDNSRQRKRESQHNSSQPHDPNAGHYKIFSDDEGEYVDYEEVK